VIRHLTEWDQTRVGKKIFESKPEGRWKLGRAQTETVGRCRE
jgi:hypothetical protein